MTWMLWVAASWAGGFGDVGAPLSSGDLGFGASVASAGDVNGDGVTDAIVGKYRSGVGDGAAYVYLGGKKGLAAEPQARLTGTVADSGFGFSVAGAGDIDGDGFGDVLVGSNANRNGEVALFRGGPNGIDPVAAATLTGGPAFGYAVSGAGDVDHDGFDDVVVGQWAADDDRGVVRLYRGSPDGLSTSGVELDPPVGGYFGWSVAGVGDVNGDGFADVAVGAWAAESAYVFAGSAAGLVAAPLVTWTGAQGSQLGHAVAAAGDVDGDGAPDVLVSAPGAASLAGQVSVFLGGAAPADAPLVTWEGAGADAGFGEAIAGGDLNDDGVVELLVGAPGLGDGSGSVLAFHVDEGAAVEQVDGGEVDGRFGAAVAFLSDREGGGDALIGAPGAGLAVPVGGAGCGCSAAPSGGSPWLVVAVLLLGCRARRQNVA
jgi:hypothetical protein